MKSRPSYEEIELVDGQVINDLKLLFHIEARINAEGDCLVWTGTKNSDGYGRMFLGWNKFRQPIRRFAHRMFYEIVNGTVPKELDIDHLCRNRACVNPTHLEAVTRKINVNRGLVPQMLRDRAANMTHCKRGHIYEGENKVINNKRTGAKTCRTCRNEAKRRAYHMKKQLKSIRHGEILLYPVSKFPRGKMTNHKSYIVGHSETQHHHVLEATEEFKVIKTGKDNVWLELFAPAKLVHKKDIDKHATLKVAPGKYQVIYKQEYNPWEKVIRRVVD